MGLARLRFTLGWGQSEARLTDNTAQMKTCYEEVQIEFVVQV